MFFVAAKEGKITTIKEAKKLLSVWERIDAPAGHRQEVESHQASA